MHLIRAGHAFFDWKPNATRPTFAKYGVNYATAIQFVLRQVF